jgi:hypothetical protein
VQLSLQQVSSRWALVGLDGAIILATATIMLLLGYLDRRRKRESEDIRCQHEGCGEWRPRRAMTRVSLGEHGWTWWCPNHCDDLPAPVDDKGAEEAGVRQRLAWDDPRDGQSVGASEER